MPHARCILTSGLLLIVLNTVAFSQTVPSCPAPEKDPFVGTWKANADKSHPKLDKRDASYVRVIARESDERISSSRILHPSQKGKFSENHFRIRCDGLMHSVACGAGRCSMSCTYRSANFVEGETLSPDGGHSYWTEEASSDGTEMRTRHYKDKSRTKLKSEWVLDRVK